jgi:hypothetical protein
MGEFEDAADRLSRLRFDPDKPAGSSLDVIIKVTSADMNSVRVMVDYHHQ